ncbi:MAG: hypothetical protein ACQEXG_00535 [Pseudomonadota bacterium]
MSTATIDTTDSLGSPLGMGNVALMAAGWLLLAVGVLATGWEPIELPLGLACLTAAAAALLHPDYWQGEETRETVNSLILASLITLAGFHLLA